MARDLGEWDPRCEDYEGWGGTAPPSLHQPSTSRAEVWGHRPRGLYVKNLPSTTDKEDVRRLFSEFGKVESVVMGRPGPDPTKPRWAIINPHTTRDAVKMVTALHAKPPLGLSITPAISPEEKRRRQREKEEEELFLEEVRRDVLAARLEAAATPVIKTDRDVVNPVVTTTTTTSTTTPPDSTTTTSTTTLPDSTTTTLPDSTTTTATTTTTTTSPDSTTTIVTTRQTPFQVGCGRVMVSYRPPEPCVGCAVAAGLLVCSVCEAWYCSKACQEAHWPHHQASCGVASASRVTPDCTSPLAITKEQGAASSSPSKIPECYTVD